MGNHKKESQENDSPYFWDLSSKIRMGAKVEQTLFHSVLVPEVYSR